MDKPLVTITYKLANGGQISVEVSTSVKELLEQPGRQIRSQRRQDRRHLDFAVQTDDDLENSLLPAHEDTADLLERMERDSLLHEAIGKLTEVQQRRFRGGCTLCRSATGIFSRYLFGNGGNYQHGPLKKSQSAQLDRLALFVGGRIYAGNYVGIGNSKIYLLPDFVQHSRF